MLLGMCPRTGAVVSFGGGPPNEAMNESMTLVFSGSGVTSNWSSTSIDPL